MIEMQAWFFLLMRVSEQSSDQVDHKIDRTAMRRMLNLPDILELVDNRFNIRPFAQQELVRQMHESIFHVCVQSCDELKSLFKQELGERSANGAMIPKEPASQSCDHLGHRSAIIDIASCQTTGQQFASIIDRQVQFEPKEPSHARLATLGIKSLDPMPTDAAADHRRSIDVESMKLMPRAIASKF